MILMHLMKDHFQSSIYKCESLLNTTLKFAGADAIVLQMQIGVL